jgi:hypothetical protein
MTDGENASNKRISTPKAVISLNVMCFETKTHQVKGEKN